MKDKRPVNLAIHTIVFPVAALASIAHRISGVVLFLGSGGLIYALGYALGSTAQFEQVRAWLVVPWVRFALFCVLLSWLYHTLAGVRHLLMDLGYGEGLVAGRISASLVFLSTAILAVLLILWLCDFDLLRMLNL